MKEYKDYSIDELKQEAASLHQTIHTTECFGVKDLVKFELVARELEKRGLEVLAEETLTFKESIKCQQ